MLSNSKLVFTDYFELEDLREILKGNSKAMLSTDK